MSLLPLFIQHWQLPHCGTVRVAAGTAHGLGIVDFVQRRVIYAKCTLNPAGQWSVVFIINDVELESRISAQLVLV